MTTSTLIIEGLHHGILIFITAEETAEDSKSDKDNSM